MRVITRLCVAAAIASAANATSARSAPEGVGAVAATVSGSRFTVRIPEPRLDPVAGTPYSRLDLDGFDPATAPGTPLLPARIVHVAVPARGAVTVRASAVGTRTVEGVQLAPTPEYIERGAPIVETLIPRRGAYARRAGAPVPARLLGVSWLRNQRVASIVIEPAQWDPSTLRLEVAVEIAIEVIGEPQAPTEVAAETEDPFERTYREILVNYEQGRAWRRAAVSTEEQNGRRDFEPQSIAAIVDSSVFVGHVWVKLAIPAPGFYRVTFGQVRNTLIFGGSITTPTDSVRLFTWPGVPVLPENSFCDTCDYREVAVAFVDKQNDSVFNDNEDYFYFYALGPNDWVNVYDPARPDTVHLNHPYDSNNYYYLTVGTAEAPVTGTPARIEVRDATPVVDGGEITPTTFRQRIHKETDAEYFPDATPYYPSTTSPNSYFWEKWFWRSLDTGRSFGEVFDAPGADTTIAPRVRVRLWGLGARDTCRDDPSRPDHLIDLEWNGTTINRYAWDALRGFTIDATMPSFKRAGNELRVAVPSFDLCPSRINRIGFAWYDVFYQRKFQPVQDQLDFESPAAPGDYLFRIAPFTTDTLPPRVFDVTDPYRPVELVSFTYLPTTGGYELSFERTQNGVRRYRILKDASIARIPATSIADAPTSSLVNLRSSTRRADYLVVFYDGFKQAADLLTAWRREHNGFETDSVPVSALYDQFSGGRTDPAAIRNFLRATYRSWAKKPTYVTLMGDASYDFKNLTGRAPAGQPGTLLPSYEGGFDNVVSRQFATDDWLLNVDNAVAVVPDFYGGRIPVNDAATALEIVRNKVILYESQAPLGEYRNRVMLIADDQFQGPLDDGLDFLHVLQTGVLDSSSTPQHMDRKYVYMHTYPDGPGNTKPGAKADIKQNLNDGVALFNYIGHGSPFKLSDESVFLDTDVGTLTNTTRLPIFIAASCDIGKFNDPTVQSLGERLLITPGRGAIGVVSATELALSGQNSALNQNLYNRLFRRDAVTGQYKVSVAEALLASKSGATNSQKYQLLGDAATVPNFPRLWAELTLYDSSGVVPVTVLERGRTLKFRGRVLDRPGPGGTPVPIDGVASMLIEDSAPRLDPPACPFCTYRPKFYYAAGPVFRGDVAMTAGNFEGRFVVPLEARTGGRARMRSYVRTPDGVSVPVDGVGNVKLQLNPGSAPAGDVTGPRIALSFPSGATTVRPDATLRIDLSDPSGILITGHTPQNGIIVTVDGNTTGRVDITESFRYAADSYQAGTALFRLPNLAEGGHTIEVSAADNLAAGLGAASHRAQATIAFEVVVEPPLRIARAYLFPNPAESGGPGSGGRFVVDAPGDSVNALLRIYTVSGRLIRTLRQLGGFGQIQIPWNGLDEEAAELANGVYLFKVHLNARDPDGSSSARQKADIEGRFVIVNR